MDKNLLTKNGTAVVRLARRFLTMEEGQKIKPVGEYADQFGMGRGTIQAALKYLEDSGAVVISAKRHNGTFIDKIDYKKLWDLSDLKTVTGVMPLPYSRRYEGMATGLYKAFEKAGIPLSLAYMRGGYRREEVLLDGKYDFAVMSLLAAETLKTARKNVEVVADFGEYSYVGGHKVLLSDSKLKTIESGMRVALDNSSVDQLLLTKAECAGKDVTYVDLSYNQILENLQKHNIDAAVWNVDEITDRRLDTPFFDFQQEEARRLEEKATVAAIVVVKSKKAIINVFKHLIDRDLILDIQKKVLSCELLPEY